MGEIKSDVDDLACHPRERVSMCVSMDQRVRQFCLFRLICGDVNPEGPGSKFQVVNAAC